MGFNGSGVYSLPSPQYPAVANTTIKSADFNTIVGDIAAALSLCLTKDGQQTLAANLNAGGFLINNLGTGVARTDAANLGQVQDQTPLWGGTAGGTCNAMTITLTPAVTNLVAGHTFRFITPATPMSGAGTTLAVNGLAAGNVLLRGSAVPANLLPINTKVDVTYDGTNFHLTLPLAFDISTDNTLGFGSGSNFVAPSQAAVKTYVNGQVSAAVVTTNRWAPFFAF